MPVKLLTRSTGRRNAYGSVAVQRAENVATITVRQVNRGREPILLASHDADDGMWQFLTGEPVERADAVIVRLLEVYQFDPSIRVEAEGFASSLKEGAFWLYKELAMAFELAADGGALSFC